jgi:hypothetical protein
MYWKIYMFLLLLAFVAGLSLIFHLDIDDHPSSTTQSRDPNTLKVEFGVVNFGTLYVVNESN